MNKIFLFAIFGFALLLLLGCTQYGQQNKMEKKEDKMNVSPATPPPAESASLGEGDQKLKEDDLPPDLPQDEDEKELDKMLNELG